MSSRARFIDKHGRDAWDAKQWVDSYSDFSKKSSIENSKDLVTSKRTAKQFKELMKTVSHRLRTEHKTTLQQATPAQHQVVLEHFSERINQGSLNNMRIAMQKGFRINPKYQPVNKEDKPVTLTMVRSDKQQALKSRSYTNEGMKLIHREGIAEKHKLSFEIAAVAGVRSSEVPTLRPIAERPVEYRANRVEVYPDRQGWVAYSVIGKGGMITKVMLPPQLSERLEALRIEPTEWRDRGLLQTQTKTLDYRKVYDVTGGNTLSAAFTRGAQKVLGFSNGIHGCRHSYAQRRMTELARFGLGKLERLLVVSQEMGHLRPDITECYLR